MYIYIYVCVCVCVYVYWVNPSSSRREPVRSSSRIGLYPSMYITVTIINSAKAPPDLAADADAGPLSLA